MCFSNLPIFKIEILKKAILNLKFKLPTNNSNNNKFKFQGQHSFSEYFHFLDWETCNRITLSEKKPPLSCAKQEIDTSVESNAHEGKPGKGSKGNEIFNVSIGSFWFTTSGFWGRLRGTRSYMYWLRCSGWPASAFENQIISSSKIAMFWQ